MNLLKGCPSLAANAGRWQTRQKRQLMAHTSFWERRKGGQGWQGGQGWEWGQQRARQRQFGEWHQLQQVAGDAPTMGCRWVPLLQAATQEG